MPSRKSFERAGNICSPLLENEKKKVLWYFHATVLFILAQMSLALYHHYMKNRKLAPVVRSDVQVRLVSCHEASLSGF